MQAAACEVHDDEASRRVVVGRPAGGRAVRPWAGRLRATHPSDHRTDRLHTGERLLGARRPPLDDAADRAPAVPDDPDDEARARHPGHRPCPLAPLLRRATYRWAAGFLRRLSTAASEKAHFRWALPIFLPEYP
jgi:hypothetical protein